MTTEPVPVWPGEFVGLPDVGNIFVRSAPALSENAQPAVFVHGLGGASTNWTDLMDVLRRPAAGGSKPDLPALDGEALDLPGFGYSPVPADGDYSVTGRARAVIGLIEQRRNGPVHLVGNSLGGAVCTRVAALRPDLIRTLTLISPALPDLWPRPLPLRVSVLCAPGLGAWVLRRVGLIPAEVRTATVVKDVYADPALMHPVRYAEATAEVLRRDELDYHNAVMIASARGPGRRVHPARPALAVAGRGPGQCAHAGAVRQPRPAGPLGPGRPGGPGVPARPGRGAAADRARRDDGAVHLGGQGDPRTAQLGRQGRAVRRAAVRARAGRGRGSRLSPAAALRWPAHADLRAPGDPGHRGPARRAGRGGPRPRVRGRDRRGDHRGGPGPAAAPAQPGAGPRRARARPGRPAGQRVLRGQLPGRGRGSTGRRSAGGCRRPGPPRTCPRWSPRRCRT